MPTATTAPVLTFVHAIIFRVVFVMVNTDAAVAEPWTAIVVTDAANPAGAAWTDQVETAPQITAAGSATPRRAKNFRIFSTARLTRILAASSVVPSDVPTS